MDVSRNSENVHKTLIPVETPTKPLSLATRVSPAMTVKSPMLMTMRIRRRPTVEVGKSEYVFGKRTKKSALIHAWIWSLDAWLSDGSRGDKCWSLLIPDIKSHLSRDG